MNVNEVARAMVDVEPSADLETRIRARLDRATPGHSAVWWLWRVGVPAAAAAAITLVVVMRSPATTGNPPRTDIESKAATSGQVSLVEVPAQEIRAAADTAARPVRSVHRAGAPEVPNAPALSEAELAWMDRRMPALEPVAALQLERLRVDSIQPLPLAISPLTMTPVGTEGAEIERRNDK